MTWRELLMEGKNILTAGKIEDAELDAWLLLEYVSQMDRARFFLRQQENAPEENIRQYRDLIRQRGSHIPVRRNLWDWNFLFLRKCWYPDRTPSF